MRYSRTCLWPLGIGATAWRMLFCVCGGFVFCVCEIPDKDGLLKLSYDHEHNNDMIMIYDDQL